jgi:hypothetical protein
MAKVKEDYNSTDISKMEELEAMRRFPVNQTFAKTGSWRTP